MAEMSEAIKSTFVREILSTIERVKESFLQAQFNTPGPVTINNASGLTGYRIIILTDERTMVMCPDRFSPLVR